MARPTKPGRAEGEGPAKLSREDKRAQATLMMMERLFGNATIRSLAESHNLAPATVQRRLRQARQDGVPEEARNVFIREMLPQSMVRLQEALVGEDLRLATQVALKVVEGLKAMETPEAAALGGMVEETLEVWKARRVRRMDEDQTGDGLDAEPADRGGDGVIDLVALPPGVAGEPAPGSTSGPAPVCVPADEPVGPPTSPTSDSSDPRPRPGESGVGRQR